MNASKSVRKSVRILTPTEIGFQLLILNFAEFSTEYIFSCTVQFVAITMDLLIDFSSANATPNAIQFWLHLVEFAHRFCIFIWTLLRFEWRKTTNVLWWLLTNWNDATGCDIVIGFSCNTARDSVMGKTKEQRGNELVERRNKSCVQKTNW